jgi:hypothetical protein
VNRDTASFATKLSHVEHLDGSHRSVMKHPSTDSKKVSLPGELQVARNSDGVSHFAVFTKVPAEQISATGCFF